MTRASGDGQGKTRARATTRATARPTTRPRPTTRATVRATIRQVVIAEAEGRTVRPGPAGAARCAGRAPPGGARPFVQRRLRAPTRAGAPQSRQLHRGARRHQRRPPHARLRRQPVHRRQLHRREPRRGRHHVPKRRPVRLLLAGAAARRHRGEDDPNARRRQRRQRRHILARVGAAAVPRQPDRQGRRRCRGSSGVITGDAKAVTNGPANAKRSGRCTGFTNRSSPQVPAVPAGQPGPADPGLPELLGRREHRQRQPPRAHRLPGPADGAARRAPAGAAAADDADLQRCRSGRRSRWTASPSSCTTRSPTTATSST